MILSHAPFLYVSMTLFVQKVLMQNFSLALNLVANHLLYTKPYSD